ncbi:hypothetical protein QL285_030780 [Trifolium repens]|nr:hypothetical protein QL285_030780 [Trifolium repens]
MIGFRVLDLDLVESGGFSTIDELMNIGGVLIGVVITGGVLITGAGRAKIEQGNAITCRARNCAFIRKGNAITWRARNCAFIRNRAKVIVKMDFLWS